MSIIYVTQRRKNRIINGRFDSWQWGTTQGSTVNNYGSDDRWQNNYSGSTRTVTQQAFTLGQTDVPGEPEFYSRTTVTTASGASNFVAKTQFIEDVRTLAGETAVLSFMAKADGSKDIATEFLQHFGTGGSPSSNVTTIGVTTHSLTTSWQNFFSIVSIPSISGKTLGTSNTDTLRVFFWFEAGSNFDSRTNSLGNQSGTFDLANVQLVPGSIVTDFEYIPPAVNTELCQRYFCKSYNYNVDPGTGSASPGYITELSVRNIATYTHGVRFPTRMRATPTVTIYSSVSGASGNVDAGGTDRVASAAVPSESGISAVQLTGSSTAEGVNWHYTADAELY